MNEWLIPKKWYELSGSFLFSNFFFFYHQPYRLISSCSSMLHMYLFYDLSQFKSDLCWTSQRDRKRATKCGVVGWGDADDDTGDRGSWWLQMMKKTKKLKLEIIQHNAKVKIKYWDYCNYKMNFHLRKCVWWFYFYIFYLSSLK